MHRFSLALAGGLAALGAALPATPSIAAQRGNPMAGAPFFVDRHTAAARAAGGAVAAGRNDVARSLGVIAAQPQTRWFTAPDDPLRSPFVLDYFRRWRRNAPGTILTIALHGLPNQVCAGENRPGLRSLRAYRRWVDRWRRRIGGKRVVVVVEPDALPASRCLGSRAKRERFAAITYATRRLAGLPHTGVYIDAGAGDWLPVRGAAALLRRAGVRWARGFTLNITHYDWTGAEVRYGQKLGRMLGGKHFIVNTAYNGRGPATRGRYHLWCNPPGRSLGPVATARTHRRGADAFFWIGSPGFSNGHCNGGPRVGTFWLEFALELVGNTGRARDFPTLNAHPRRR
jgi:endoglucanase